MAGKRVFKLDKVPKGSRLEKYLEELPKVVKASKAQILSFLNSIFIECLEFVKQNTDIAFFPAITLKLVHTHERFKREEQRESKKATSKEVAKAPATAFVVGNRFKVRIYIDLESFINLLKFGYPTFIMNLVETYIHEILHIGYPQKDEQEIHDLECPLIETFLGIELPKEIKNLKVSDYYFKKVPENS